MVSGVSSPSGSPAFVEVDLFDDDDVSICLDDPIQEGSEEAASLEGRVSRLSLARDVEVNLSDPSEEELLDSLGGERVEIDLADASEEERVAVELLDAPEEELAGPQEEDPRLSAARPPREEREGVREEEEANAENTVRIGFSGVRDLTDKIEKSTLKKVDGVFQKMKAHIVEANNAGYLNINAELLEGTALNQETPMAFTTNNVVKILLENGKLLTLSLSKLFKNTDEAIAKKNAFEADFQSALGHLGSTKHFNYKTIAPGFSSSSMGSLEGKRSFDSFKSNRLDYHLKSDMKSVLEMTGSKDKKPENDQESVRKMTAAKLFQEGALEILRESIKEKRKERNELEKSEQLSDDMRSRLTMLNNDIKEIQKQIKGFELISPFALNFALSVDTSGIEGAEDRAEKIRKSLDDLMAGKGSGKVVTFFSSKRGGFSQSERKGLATLVGSTALNDHMQAATYFRKHGCEAFIQSPGLSNLVATFAEKVNSSEQRAEALEHALDELFYYCHDRDALKEKVQNRVSGEIGDRLQEMSQARELPNTSISDLIKLGEKPLSPRQRPPQPQPNQPPAPQPDPQA